ncbi:MAG: hypothetical protein ACUVTW_14865, partial [Thermogutta sp.]
EMLENFIHLKLLGAQLFGTSATMERNEPTLFASCREIRILLPSRGGKGAGREGKNASGWRMSNSECEGLPPLSKRQ